MPLPKLLERLKEKTGERVIRADEDLAVLLGELENNTSLTAAELAEFKSHTREDPSPNKLWIEVDVLDE
jgi:hypothetical protein